MKIYKLLLLFTVSIILTACTDDSEVNQNTNAEASTSGGDLVASYPSDAGSLDPAGTNDLASDQRRGVIYEGLLTLNEDLETKPKLATDYEQVNDTTWVFHLREDVTFHDGTAFNASAVKASLERIIDPAVASSRAYIFEMIDEVNVIDDYTVEIVTTEPFAPLLSYLTHDGAGIISKSVIDEDYQNALDQSGSDLTLEEFYQLRQAGGEEYQALAEDLGEFTGAVVEEKPTGTGYMKLQERNPGESIVVERFDDYWDTPAKLDTITFKVVAEDGSRIAELESGQSHFIQGFENGQWARIENNPELEIQSVYNISTEYLGMNTQKGALKDKRVRQAIGHLVDKEAIMDGIYDNVGRSMKGALQEEVLGFNEGLEDLEYDPERAKALLAEAGYEDGLNLKLLTNDTPERVDMAVWLQEQFKDANITIEIEQIEWGAYLEAISNGEQDLFILGWPNSVGDPDQGLWPILHSSMLGTGGNRYFLENEEIDHLLEEGRTELDEEKRQEIYEEIDKKLVEEQPAVFVRQAESANASRTEVKGIEIDHFNKPNFKNATIEY